MRFDPAKRAPTDDVPFSRLRETTAPAGDSTSHNVPGYKSSRIAIPVTLLLRGIDQDRMAAGAL